MMPKSVRLDTSNSGSQALVKGSIGTEGKTPDGHITAIMEILEGDEVVYTCLVVGAVSDIAAAGEALVVWMVQKKVLSSGQVLKVRVKILSTNPPKWMYHVKEMNKEIISNWAKKQTCRSMVFNVKVVIDGEANSLTVWDCARSQKTQKYDTNNIMSSSENSCGPEGIAPTVANPACNLVRLHGLDTSAQQIKDLHGTKDPVPSNSVKWRDKRKSSPTTQKPNLKVQCPVTTILKALVLTILIGSANGQASGVMLNSTLSDEHVANPHEIVIFTCESRSAGILEWFSDEYIGTNGVRLQILSVGNTTTVPSNTDPNTIASRINVTFDNGVPVIVSELRIVTSLSYPVATVTCAANGERQNITFRMINRATNVEEVTTGIENTDRDISTTENEGSSGVTRYHIVIGACTCIGIGIAIAVIFVIIMVITIKRKMQKRRKTEAK